MANYVCMRIYFRTSDRQGNETINREINNNSLKCYDIKI